MSNQTIQIQGRNYFTVSAYREANKVTYVLPVMSRNNSSANCKESTNDKS